MKSPGAGGERLRTDVAPTEMSQGKGNGSSGARSEPRPCASGGVGISETELEHLRMLTGDVREKLSGGECTRRSSAQTASSGSPDSPNAQALAALDGDTRDLRNVCIAGRFELSLVLRDVKTKLEKGSVEYGSFRNGELDRVRRKLLRSAANTGHLESCLQLGHMHSTGDGARLCSKEGVKWYESGASQGSADAVYALASMSRAGEGMPKDDRRALALMTRAADRGHPAAQLELGRWHGTEHLLRLGRAQTSRLFKNALKCRNVDRRFLFGMLLKYSLEKVSPVDRQHAFKLSMIAVEMGVADAYVEIGCAYETGVGVDMRRSEQGLAWIRASAELGSGVGAYMLGCRYAAGRSVPISSERAIELYRKATELGYSVACLELADCYFYGQGSNMPEGVRWLEKGVEMGDSRAMYRLAGLLKEGLNSLQVDLPRAFELYKSAAEDGYTQAYVEVGSAYEYGEGVAKSMEDAVKWYTVGAEAGDSAAMYCLGVVLSWSDEIEPEPRRGFELLLRTAEMGHLGAQVEVGKSYDAGRGVASNTAEAVRWLTSAADARDGDAMCCLGDLYKKNHDFVQAVACFKAGVKCGAVDALVSLGILYEDGEGVEEDLKEAAKYFSRAAKMDSKYGCQCLGVMYRDGSGVEEDKKHAFELFQKAAMLGLGDAFVDVGYAYENGAGVDRNVALAIDAYTKAGELDVSAGHRSLGLLYREGTGVAKSSTKAFECFEKAAELGCLDSHVDIGYAYQLGRGVDTNVQEAIAWYQRAADMGSEHALCNMGDIFSLGLGVPEDKSEAARMYLKAAEEGFCFAQASAANVLRRGDGAPQDLENAAKWYASALSQGHYLPHETLGFVLVFGEDTSAKLVRKAGLFADAVNAGLWPQDSAGSAGCDWQALWDFYESRAGTGDGRAECCLGILCKHGIGTVAMNERRACELFSVSASHGDSEGQLSLGLARQYGEGVDVDHVLARSLYEASVGQGNVYAMLMLSRMCEAGLGMDVDRNRASDLVSRFSDAVYDAEDDELFDIV